MKRILFLVVVIVIMHCAVTVESTYIDSKTTKDTKIRQRDGKLLELVMSDEFETTGRSFAPGHDEMFEAINKPDDSNEALQYYVDSKEYVTTKDGCLVIRTKRDPRSYTVWDENNLKPITYTKNYTSGMIQSWNKFCFTGGVLEISVELPGDSRSGGLWPAAWLMGNLARATFQDSTLDIWPWSYDRCGEIDNLETKQEINKCNADPGYGLRPNQGRGAPEIDIFEVMPGHEMPGHSKPIEPFFSSSLQISPGIPVSKHRPINGKRLNLTQSWYNGLYLSPKSDYNYGFWGQMCGPVIDNTPNQIRKYIQDAISANTYLNESHFSNQHVFKIEWQPGARGYLSWYLDNELIFGIEGYSLQSMAGSLIPVEPMYLILNTAISHRWGMPEPCPVETCPMCWRCFDCMNPDCQCTLPEGMKGCKNLPAEMKIDYIRLYQDREDPLHTVGCSPPGYPTAEFIAAHAERYANWKPMTIDEIKDYSENKIAVLAMFVFLVVMLLVVVGRNYYCSNERENHPSNHRGSYQPVNTQDDESPQYYQQSAH